MNKILASLIKILLLLLGVFLQLFGLFVVFKGESILGSAIFLFGFCLVILAKNFGDIKLFIVKAALALSVLFFVSGIIMYSINDKSDELAYSIQPSIDHILVSSVDKVLEDNFEIEEESRINVFLGKNKEEIIVYSKNLSDEQADIISKEFGVSLDQNEKIYFSRIVVNQIFKEIKNQGLDNIKIPLSSLVEQYPQIKSEIEKIDFSLFEQYCSLDEESIIELFEIAKLLSSDELIQSLEAKEVVEICKGSDEAHITLILFEEEISKEINLAKLEKEDVDLIWENLELPEVSYNTKLLTSKYALNLISKEIKKTQAADIAIPLSSISSMIPDDIKTLISYDLLNEDKKIRTLALVNIRNDCEAKKIEIDEICEAIMITKYENLMLNVSDYMKESSDELELPIDPNSLISKINTVDKIEEISFKSTKNFTYLFLFSLVLFVLAIITSIMHKEEEDTNNNYELRLAKFLSKVILIDLLAYYIFITIIYLIFSKGLNLLLMKVSNFVEQEGFSEMIEIVVSIPLLEVITEIIRTIFIAVSTLILLALILFLIFKFTIYFKSKEEALESKKN